MACGKIVNLSYVLHFIEVMNSLGGLNMYSVLGIFWIQLTVHWHVFWADISRISCLTAKYIAPLNLLTDTNLSPSYWTNDGGW